MLKGMALRLLLAGMRSCSLGSCSLFMFQALFLRSVLFLYIYTVSLISSFFKRATKQRYAQRPGRYCVFSEHNNSDAFVTSDSRVVRRRLPYNNVGSDVMLSTLGAYYKFITKISEPACCKCSGLLIQ